MRLVNADLVSKALAAEKFQHVSRDYQLGYNAGLDKAIKYFLNIPDKTGKWERHYRRPGVYPDAWYCSACGADADHRYARSFYKYCPNCGAEMEMGDGSV